MWAAAQGTSLGPADVTLIGATVRGDCFEVRVSDGSGRVFGYRASLPSALSEPSAGEDAARHWARWDVLVPMTEELETGVGDDRSPDSEGVVWLPSDDG